MVGLEVAQTTLNSQVARAHSSSRPERTTGSRNMQTTSLRFAIHSHDSILTFQELICSHLESDCMIHARIQAVLPCSQRVLHCLNKHFTSLESNAVCLPACLIVHADIWRIVLLRKQSVIMDKVLTSMIRMCHRSQLPSLKQESHMDAIESQQSAHVSVSIAWHLQAHVLCGSGQTTTSSGSHSSNRFTTKTSPGNTQSEHSRSADSVNPKPLRSVKESVTPTNRTSGGMSASSKSRTSRDLKPLSAASQAPMTPAATPWTGLVQTARKSTPRVPSYMRATESSSAMKKKESQASWTPQD